MNIENIGYLLAWVGTGCWGVCFWWMHRISNRQDAMLKELHEVIDRIEELSKEEHELADALRSISPSAIAGRSPAARAVRGLLRDLGDQDQTPDT